jgi:hypothetical protein
MGFLREIKAVATMGLVVAAMFVLIILALPALGELKRARAELRHWEFEIDRLRNFAAQEGTENRVARNEQVPETPDVASMMSVTRLIQKEMEVDGLAFETTQIEDRYLPELETEGGEPYGYLYSEVRISFDSTTREAVAFIDALVTASPGCNIERITFSRKHDDENSIHVSMTVGLNGIPR